MKKIIIVLMFFLFSCSSVNIVSRGEYINHKSIIKGTPRVDLLARFGRPVDTKENEEGKKIDLFRVEQGETTSGKIAKGTGTAALAIGTLGLSEIIADPVTREKPMVIFEILYDKDDRVEDVKFIQLPK